MRNIIIAVLLLSALSFGTTKVHLYIKNNKIFDEKGGQRIFHGVNLVIKVPPYYEVNFGEKQIQALQAKGINGIRLGVMWPGVEPREGYIDYTYLERMVNLVNLAGKYNIYTLVEFHQDLFSQKFCGDGVPMWAVPKQVYQSFPVPVKKHKGKFNNQTGLPDPASCSVKGWSELYFTKACNRGFGHLWKNKHGLLDKFANYWKVVASKFYGNPYVVAYQLMNEPWPGNLFENPLIMVPSLSQKFHLQKAYDYLSEQIRKVDPDHNICFQPVTWLNNIESGFTHPPGGKRYSNSSIFCYHYYNPPSLNLDSFMKARLKDIHRLKVGGILSQFYIMGEEGKKNIAMMDKCDQHSQSWFGWIYPYQIPQVKRTFSHRVAGSIINQQFNHITKQYQLTYHADRSSGDTIIYLDSKQDYKVASVRIYPSFSKAKYQIVDKIYLHIDSSQFEEGSVVMIVITP